MISNEITDDNKTTIINAFKLISSYTTGAFLFAIVNSLFNILIYVLRNEISAINDSFYHYLIDISLLTTLLIAITVLVAVSPFAYYAFRNTFNYFRKREEFYLFDYESLAEQILSPRKLIYKIRKVAVWSLSIISTISLVSSGIFLVIILLGN